MLEIDLDVRKGSFRLRATLALPGPITALCGRSGSGKSTFLRAIAGLERGGGIVLNGRSLGDAPPERRRVGLVPQNSALFPHLSVGANVRYGGRWRFDEIVEALRIGDLLDRRPAALSGGQQRRVSIARALCSRPSLLLLDEPLAGLELSLRERVLAYLDRVRRECRIPIVYVSHHLEEILDRADEAVLLEGGEVRGHGPCAEVLARAGLADYVNRFAAGDLAGDRSLRLGKQILTLADPICGPSEISIRAEDILLATEEPRGLSARNILPGRVREVRTLGSRRLVTVDVGVPLVASITPEAERALSVETGRAVFCVIKATSIRSGTHADERV